MADEQQQQAPAAPQLSAHDQAMIAKVDAKAAAVEVAAGVRDPGQPPGDQQGAAQKPARPDNVPEKFWDAEKGQVNTEALLKSYTELEKTRQEVPKGDPKEGQPKADPVGETAIKAVKDAGLAEADLQAAFAESGDFKPEHYDALEKAGYPKSLVQQYLAGVKAQAALVTQEVYSVVGGEDKFKAMTAWAQANLSKGDIEAFDSAVTGTPEQRKLAVQSLKMRYDAANGSEPTLVRGDSAHTSSDGFQSRAEMTAAMRDPRYTKDPAYRAMVERKVANAAF